MSVFARVGVCSCRCLLTSVFAHVGVYSLGCWLEFLYITRAVTHHRSVRNNLFMPSPCPCLHSVFLSPFRVLVSVPCPSLLVLVLVSVLASILVFVLVSVLVSVLDSVLDSVLVSVLSSSSSAAHLLLRSSAHLLPHRTTRPPLPGALLNPVVTTSS